MSVTLEEFRYGEFRSWDLKPPVTVSSVSGLGVRDKQSALNISGMGFDSECVAVIYPQDEQPDNFEVIEGIYRNPQSCVVNWVPNDARSYFLIVASNDSSLSSPIEIEALEPLESDTSTSNKTLILRDLSGLTIGNNPNVKSQLDILYYKNIALQSNSKGVYINSKGYLIFPQLVTQKNNRKTISFVFYCGNDNSYLVFGYCSEERFNFNSNDYNKVELGLRFRNQGGCYYQHGLFDSGRSSVNFVGYQDYDRDLYYRLDIPVGGDYARMYKLENSPDKWSQGKFQQAIRLTTAPDRPGETLYPFFGNFNGERSPIAAVLIS